MVTIYTHAAVGLGLGKVCTARRMPVLFWVLAALLPVLPDLDVFSRAGYGTMLGHRGFTHSFAFAFGVGLAAAALTFYWFRVRLVVLAAFFCGITATHAILDAFTNGGEGIPFFWPLSNRRFGPWGPIQVADIGFELPDPRTSRSIRQELLYVWLPLAVLIVLVVSYRRLRRLLSPKEGKTCP